MKRFFPLLLLLALVLCACGSRQPTPLEQAQAEAELRAAEASRSEAAPQAGPQPEPLPAGQEALPSPEGDPKAFLRAAFSALAETDACSFNETFRFSGTIGKKDASYTKTSDLHFRDYPSAKSLNYHEASSYALRYGKKTDSSSYTGTWSKGKLTYLFGKKKQTSSADYLSMRAGLYADLTAVAGERLLACADGFSAETAGSELRLSFSASTEVCRALLLTGISQLDAPLADACTDAVCSGENAACTAVLDAGTGTLRALTVEVFSQTLASGDTAVTGEASYSLRITATGEDVIFPIEGISG